MYPTENPCQAHTNMMKRQTSCWNASVFTEQVHFYLQIIITAYLFLFGCEMFWKFGLSWLRIARFILQLHGFNISKPGEKPRYDLLNNWKTDRQHNITLETLTDTNHVFVSQIYLPLCSMVGCWGQIRFCPRVCWLFFQLELYVLLPTTGVQLGCSVWTVCL